MRTRRLMPMLLLGAITGFFFACASTNVGVTSKVKAKLAMDDAVRAYEINVDTKDGVVTLKGTVESQQEKDRAIQIAKETSGVVDVVDMISVEDSDRSIGEKLDDASITMRVKTKLLEDSDVGGLKIDVDTLDGVVTLTGTVRSQDEKEKALQLAKATNGVRDVRSNLTITFS